ncbi:MAG: 2-oxo acid dehydrogenase subunit E2 [Treponema sp.]|jgi:pyruvate dehydrogenase E2 component (dihydrolipoamide acetyltransferase)|nr:2-oxo acid dehydrogenase subunit E2 [Treponema sp.]
MAHVLIMPRQGNTVESCIIGEWKVKEGDPVAADVPVCVVETDKATFEVPAGAAGIVLKILREAGDDVPVLEPIMVLGEAGESWEAVLSASGKQAPAAEVQAAGAKAGNEAAAPPGGGIQAGSGSETGTVSGGISQTGGRTENIVSAASPRARKLAEREAVDLSVITSPSGPGGRIIEPDVIASIAGRPPLTEAAKAELRRRITAGEASGSITAGSGIGGRITAGDLQETGFSGEGPGAGPAAGFAGPEYSDAPVKGIRKLIAAQMMESHSNTAAFTLNASAPALNLLGLRARFKASDSGLGLNKITINDLILFAVSRILPLYPYMNAHRLGDTLRSFRTVHLGVAVSTPRGLMVPVIRNAETLSLLQISAKARELAGACRSGSVSPDDLHGSTLTVTNLGNTGIESFTPVINIPEVAILGICSILPRPAETSPGNYEILPHLGLSLTIDHAVVDGAPAAEFLKAFAAAIKDIDLWLAK